VLPWQPNFGQNRPKNHKNTKIAKIPITLYSRRGSAPNMGLFLIWAPLISVPYVTYATEVRHVFCAPAMPKSSEHILTSIWI